MLSLGGPSTRGNGLVYICPTRLPFHFIHKLHGQARPPKTGRGDDSAAVVCCKMIYRVQSTLYEVVGYRRRGCTARMAAKEMSHYIEPVTKAARCWLSRKPFPRFVFRVTLPSARGCQLTGVRQ